MGERWDQLEGFPLLIQLVLDLLIQLVLDLLILRPLQVFPPVDYAQSRVARIFSTLFWLYETWPPEPGNGVRPLVRHRFHRRPRRRYADCPTPPRLFRD